MLSHWRLGFQHMNLGGYKRSVCSTWCMQNTKQKGLKNAVIDCSRKISEHLLCIQPCAGCYGEHKGPPATSILRELPDEWEGGT